MKAKKLFKKYQLLDEKERIKFLKMTQEKKPDNLSEKLNLAKELLKTVLDNNGKPIIDKDWIIKQFFATKKNERNIEIK